ncbi:calmodulin-binding protein 60 C-like [Impatiens glandulifera]|uniref:calmodulin-binding protein 60 C-like n=1 Tax=Impatiens glandulifera TaxID=253017 RepID=UPI001FB123B6|nr:calmodulin-binding protein 60 C-like [Impatiens glandulifera]
MAKRPLDSSSNEESNRDPKRPALASVIVEALKVDSLQKLCSSLEPILRRVVSEEVERALSRLNTAKFGARSSPRTIQGFDGRNLQLQFRSKLSLPLFTGGKVESEQSGTPIHVVLIDANTQQIVKSSPESSSKLEIVVLEGDFNNEDADEQGWSREEFESHIVKEREGKRPLLSGDLQVVLKDGVGKLGEIAFTDNSSWIRSRKFRLGLKVVSSGFCDGIRIREAKSDAFTVKDHRGELYKKHYPPSLNDEVWRLEKIGKDGSFHKRLSKSGIHRVEDFLRFVVRDAQGLRNILGSGMSNKMWDVLVEHAKTCVISGKLYIYYDDEAKNIGVVFNNIYEFSGLIAGEDYYSSESISESQKAYVDTLVKKAYENWMHVIEYDGKSILKDINKSASPPINNAMNISQDYSNSFESQTVLPSLPLSIPSQQSSTNTGLINPLGGIDHGLDSSYINPTLNNSFATFMMGGHQESHVPITDDILATQALTSGFHTGVASNFGSYGNNISDLISDEDIQMRSHAMLENDNMQHLLGLLNMDAGCQSSTSTLDSRYPYSTNPAFNNYGLTDEETRSSDESIVGWLKLKAALRWGIFIRKKAAERRAQLIELDDN